MVEITEFVLINRRLDHIEKLIIINDELPEYTIPEEDTVSEVEEALSATPKEYLIEEGHSPSSIP
jgi:Glu-tRNA(Gln) amidotransferase subunit E-like FAD-binding protein